MTATVEESLELVNGIRPDERDRVVDLLGRLDHRLRSYRSGSVTLLLSVKERESPGQRTTLEARLPGKPAIVATSDRAGFQEAIHEVRDDLISQITDAKNRTEPRNSRSRRSTASTSSAHADSDGLVAWLRSSPTPPASVSVVHGEAGAADSLRRRIEHELSWAATVPVYGDTIDI